MSTSMTETSVPGSPREDSLAWDLVDHVGDRLSDEERHSVFVDLGVGDYPPAIRVVLEAVARERISLSDQLIALLHAWMVAYDRHREFSAVIARAVGEWSPSTAQAVAR